MREDVDPHGLDSVEQPGRRVDHDAAGGVLDDEDHRDERAGVELEQVGGRVGDDGDARAARRAVDLDDGRADQLVHPQLVGVVERLGVDRGVGVALRRRRGRRSPRT